jgi:galactokinase/mevalonate kinase-like predicted kinase
MSPPQQRPSRASSPGRPRRSASTSPAGWSDTPPICLELGGTVLNGAVTLNGRQPIQSVARLTDERVLRISSIDLGRAVTLTETEQVLDHSDPTDWAALAKAALVLAGACPGDPERRLADWLDRIGGGIDLAVLAAVPKGSGLGTSSILGAVVLASLSTLLGHDASVDVVTARTSLLEQMMHTGGGWQDQVGGLTPGIKLLRTGPGREQIPSVEPIRVPPGAMGELRDRTLLYYTGYQRMARDILQNVVNRYLDHDPEALRILAPLKRGAERMKNDLERGDIDAFAAGVAEYWRFKSSIDPGATNDRIRSLVAPLEDQLSGYELPGAGGGGFLFMIARDTEAAGRVQQILRDHPPNAHARFYELAFDEVGLNVDVL